MYESTSSPFFLQYACSRVPFFTQPTCLSLFWSVTLKISLPLRPSTSESQYVAVSPFSPLMQVAVPYSALPQIGRENAAALAGKIILDASNPVVRRDGQVAEEAMANGIGATSLKYLPGTRYVRAFNPVGTAALERESHRAGTPIGMPVAGDDAQAVKTAMQLVRDAGFEPVVLPLSRSMAFAPGTEIFGRATPVDELRQKLGAAK